jgi:predicted TPR repeat methyltransferase
MSAVFDAYARYYDLLYADKDYEAEARYVASHVREHVPDARRLLELGCGTGAHAEHLARLGYVVHGIDSSEQMVARSQKRRARCPADIAEKLAFDVGDARSTRTGRHYDAVISLFHVVSYQASNSDLDATFATAATHLPRGGLFLFDFWYGPAVLAQRPTVRTKHLEDDVMRVTRTARPELNVNENCVDVRYDVAIQSKESGRVDHVNETHRMRYLFLPEIARIASLGAWSAPRAFAWMTRQPLSEKDWSGCVALIRR